MQRKSFLKTSGALNTAVAQLLIREFKPPPGVKDVWAVRIRLQLEHRARGLALLNPPSIASVRGCDLVRLRRCLPSSRPRHRHSEENGVVTHGGRLLHPDDERRSESYADILGRAGLTEIEARGQSAADPPARSTYAMHAHGAVFAEVKVDPELGQIRVTRVVGAFAAGRVINPSLVRSQLFGGMIWGVSFALHEHAVVDRRSGRTLNANLADYRVPVSADVPSLEALMIEEHDPHVNALGIKGVGEIGITGTAGAVANAVWHATGIRVRRFPIRIDDLVMPGSD